MNNWRLKRIRFIAISSFIGSLVLALNSNPTVLYALVMPLIFIAVGLGFSRLFREWNGIFPRNPIAKTIGIIPIGLLMAVIIGHGLFSYFIAYGKSPETKAAYTQR